MTVKYGIYFNFSCQRGDIPCGAEWGGGGPDHPLPLAETQLSKQRFIKYQAVWAAVLENTILWLGGDKYMHI